MNTSKKVTVKVNQFFIGCPWKTIRPKYEQVIAFLKEEYPIECVIVGRTTGHDAKELWGVIRDKIEESALCIFDAGFSNPNVALEFGYAEGAGKRSILMYYERKSKKLKSDSSIISDLAGTIRKPWKSTKSLKMILRKEFEQNTYVRNFMSFVRKHKYAKKKRLVAVAAIHILNGQKKSKPDLILALENKFPTYKSIDFGKIIDQLAKAELLLVKPGRYGGVSVPRI